MKKYHIKIKHRKHITFLAKEVDFTFSVMVKYKCMYSACL